MNPITFFLTVVSAAIGAALFAGGLRPLGIAFFVLAVLIAASLKMANVWQRFVILRAGKLQGVKGPGLFFILPIIDNVVAVIDERIQTPGFNAERILTKEFRAGEIILADVADGELVFRSMPGIEPPPAEMAGTGPADAS